MTRSSVWPSEWVGNETCCVRLRENKISENCLACESDGSSTWMLKSPVMTKWCGTVANSEIVA